MTLTAFHQYTPQPPLSFFVEHFWLSQGPVPAHSKERRLPDGSISLIINLHDERIRLYDQHHSDQLLSYSNVLLSGAHAEFVLLDTTCLAEVLGVQFKPGGTVPFLPFPASDLHNDFLSLDNVWGPDAFALRECLCAFDQPQRRFQLMEHFLLARLKRSHEIHPVVVFALGALEKAPTPPTITAIVEQIGLSRTRFIQLFRETVGVTPKQFARLQRFQRVLCSIEQNRSQSWIELALTYGYYDQAHFIHDFQAFSGLTPSAYLAQYDQHRNHVPYHE
ncbi:AraC family transcriptional regulator [Reticulibacter mediterranei]|uniref:AraC family transcriptional regulator n=1 Tax=Reticulibacter mediterranei TaxID=2778369 RepID=A0A8J3IWQ9_9CHLR|nr:helix-turn-helix domain-containing protein [Reticulibacter mediterranei]GHO99920.1 AraC family transcriptional regulator [Reticulibacter mediterranei]